MIKKIITMVAIFATALGLGYITGRFIKDQTIQTITTETNKIEEIKLDPTKAFKVFDNSVKKPLVTITKKDETCRIYEGMEAISTFTAEENNKQRGMNAFRFKTNPERKDDKEILQNFQDYIKKETKLPSGTQSPYSNFRTDCGGYASVEVKILNQKIPNTEKSKIVLTRNGQQGARGPALNFYAQNTNVLYYGDAILSTYDSEKMNKECPIEETSLSVECVEKILLDSKFQEEFQIAIEEFYKFTETE
ncbi:MAG: hypothetical protein ACRCXZ_03435 [Patescibacteria group bacterium]